MVVTSLNQLFETFLGSAFSYGQIVPWLLWRVQILFSNRCIFTVDYFLRPCDWYYRISRFRRNRWNVKLNGRHVFGTSWFQKPDRWRTILTMKLSAFRLFPI